MALKAAYAAKGVEFMMLDSTAPGRQPRGGHRRRQGRGLDMPILFDYEQLVGEELGVTRAAEVIVIDPKTWTVAYRGAGRRRGQGRGRRAGRRPAGRADQPAQAAGRG